MLKKLQFVFLDDNQRVRNGWWIAIFLVFVALTRPIYKPIKHFFIDLGLAEQWLEPLSFLLILAATWLCTRLRKETLSSVGLKMNYSWMSQLTIGSLLGAAMVAVITLLIWLVGGIEFELNPARGINLVGYGLFVMLFTALFEELLHRGFLFQRLIDGAGIWAAQILIATIFASGHWGNPDMQGMTQVWASIELFLGAIIFGLAYLKTKSLALPVGLHLGWNFFMGAVLGFGVSGHQQSGWFTPLFQDMPQWISGGQFGPEASIFAVAVDLVVLVVLWQWQGMKELPNCAEEMPLTQSATA